MNKQTIEFRKKGYFIQRNVFNISEINRIKRSIHLFVKLYPEFCVFEDSKLDTDRVNLFQCFNFINECLDISDVIESSMILDFTSKIFKDESNLFLEAFHFKQSGGGAFKPHQDLQSPVIKYINSTLPPNQGVNTIISVCIAIDEHTISNGCINTVEGSHKKGLLGKVGNNTPTELCDVMNFKPMELRSGDVLFFDGNTVHSSEINKSKDERKTLMLFYNPKELGNHRQKAIDYVTKTN